MVDEITKWIDAHGLFMLAAYWVLLAVVSSMPDPPATAGYFLRWAYIAAHALCGNVQNLGLKTTKI